ncbi:dolichyl-diphosphooligosaccharide--protein glycosyltransferase subunit 1A [Magnolia sinica]|uniref:dolichyl-diphosphooligosaccharide--protein glycosyltransferase subunit 1A n=1 Tax=Magnolia sinica TaxID=86752 RepID=UPI002659F08C|nr:dolichyl-diphosphooligosaccharide--protein glycosyltransferase subunit 1A [Magnolia sinica]
MGSRFALILALIAILWTSVFSDLIISKLDRRIDLTSHVVRVSSTLKVVNEGPHAVSDVLLSIPDFQAKNLAYLSASCNEGKGKTKGSIVNLPVEAVQPGGMPPNLTVYSVSLLKGLGKSESLSLDVLAVFTHSLEPFPEEITQADTQLVLFQDSAVYLSPYQVTVQSLSVRLPSARVESYTKLQNTKLVDSEIKYGPYESLPPFSYNPVVIHFENNRPFAVAQELIREIEISHWGNVQITEHYNLVHGGARNKGGFSRIEYQARPSVRGASSFRHLIARLPPRAHSVYYRDEIGNVSTSHLWGDSRKTELEIEPRYPMFGGWRTLFTIGYGLPLQDFLFVSEGKRLLNISFGSPMDEVVIDDLIVKVVLPEGSKDISVSAPFPTKQWEEIKYSHLDIIGRPVVVLHKKNVVPEHNVHFQVYYKFNNLSLLWEPMMLISGFFFLFVACIVYVHSDISISKSSASYLAKLQWEEVQATVQQVQNVINRCLSVHDKLEASLHDLSRMGDVQACKAARKAADGLLKEYAKELKPLLVFLQSSPQAAHILPKVEELVAKEREMQERLMLKHSTVVECYEKKSGGREIENRVASHQQKLTALRHEVDDLLDTVDEI